MIGRPVPLLALLRPGTVRLLRQLDGVSSNLFANLTQSLMAIFSHRRYTSTRANEASLPLHTEKNPNPSGFFSLSDRPIRLHVVESQ